jgi:acyl carrier protein
MTQAQSNHVDNLSQQALTTWLVDQVKTIAKVEADVIDINEQFINYGLNSVDAVNLSGELEDYLGYEIPASIMYEFSTINELVQHLSSEFNSTLTTQGED